jgi:uncharacterized protein YqgC (DUF456 family)
MDLEILLWVLAALLGLLGLAGLLLPAIPGAPLLFARLLVAAWIEDFTYVGPWTLGALALLALFGLFLGVAGILIGPLIGAIVAELSARRTPEQAARAGLGATLGLVLGTAVKMALAFTMIGLFLVVRFALN